MVQESILEAHEIQESVLGAFASGIDSWSIYSRNGFLEQMGQEFIPGPYGPGIDSWSRWCGNGFLEQMLQEFEGLILASEGVETDEFSVTNRPVQSQGGF